MKLEVKFDFHNVGQGLFYTGKINDFNFVFDCGSKTKIEFLNKAIKNYKVETLKDSTIDIDILVISHFDNDHINGLDYLLKDAGVEYAIIPYCSPLEKLILASTNANSPLIYFEFLVDPVDFLLKRGVKKVLLVTGSGDIYPNNNIYQNNNRDSNKDPINLEYYKHIYKNKDELEIVGAESINDTLKNAYSKGEDFFDYWQFKHFYHEMKFNEDEFRGCLADRNISFHNGANLQKYIRNPDTRKKIKECYKKAINGNKLNLTSLAMYHGPIGLYTKKEYGISSSNLSLSGFNPISQKDEEKRIGHLLTGDINFKINCDELIEYFKDERDQTALIQIPHHGSLGNWKKTILDDFEGCKFWVASSGFSSQYSHPHRGVVSDIFEKGKLFVWCHEFSKVTISGELFPK